MDFLKTLLGDAYQDGMTLEDVSKALEGIHNTREAENTKLKSQLSKANSEAANYKKQLREKLSEAEQSENDRKSELERISGELATLKREKAIADLSMQFATLGYDGDTATANATAMVDGDSKTLIANQKLWMEHQRKEIEKNLLANTPKPAVGSPVNNGADYAKLIADAQARGDIAEAVYYNRISQEGIKN